MGETVFSGLGLSVSQFFGALPDRDLRRFLDPGVLAVLDTIFGGRIADDDLKRVAHTLVDVDMLLGDEEGRRLVLRLVPDEKLAELEDRVGRSIRPADASNWTEIEVGRMRDFFGLIEERIVPPYSTTNGYDQP